MFEQLTQKLSEEMMTLSKGDLHCLPYSRALLDFFELRGQQAKPLVVRGIVFGRLEAGTWAELDKQKMINTAIQGPRANGGMVVKFKPSGTTETRELTVPYRTIGLPHSGGHGNAKLGNFEGGSWLGHLVVVAEQCLIDLTIGQLNDPTMAINFAPPYLVGGVNEDFLTGKAPLIVEHDGMLLSYSAYPKERTYMNSRSWSDFKFKAQLKAAAANTAAFFDGEPAKSLHAVESNNQRDAAPISAQQPE